MALTIEDLLKALKNPAEEEKKRLENTKDTWSRIGSGDSFAELGLEPTDLQTFLAEFINDNPYNNI